MGYQPKQKKCLICKRDFVGHGLICKHKYHFYKCPVCKKLYKVNGRVDIYKFLKTRDRDRQDIFRIISEDDTQLIFQFIDNIHFSEGACPDCRELPEIEEARRNAYWERCSVTNIEKYGTACSVNGVAQIRQKKETWIQNYGCDNPSKAEEVKEKKKETSRINYGTDYPLQDKEYRAKLQKNFKEKHGVDNPSQLDWVKQKKVETCRINHNVDYPSQNRTVRLKTISTLHKNGFASGWEEYLYQKLLETNLEENKEFFREYHDDRYPYHCDFYFPKTDTFLEINGWWTHNDHFFDANNKRDLEVLKEWKRKSMTNSVYANAINVWTVRDVEKRECAVDNNLNYVVLWTKAEVINFCENELERVVFG